MENSSLMVLNLDMLNEIKKYEDDFEGSELLIDRELNNYLDKRLMDIFLFIGISANLQGYRYLRDAVKLVVVKNDYIGYMTKLVYPLVAHRNGTTASKVERAMRHALDLSFIKKKIMYLNDIFGMQIISQGERPTNSEFIAMLANILSLETRR